MKLILHAKPDGDRERMTLWLFASAPDMHDHSLESAVDALARRLTIDLRGIQMENCDHDEVGDLAVIRADWYVSDDYCVPAFSSIFNLALVHASIVTALRKTLRRWKHARGFKTTKAKWVLDGVVLNVEPIPD